MTEGDHPSVLTGISGNNLPGTPLLPIIASPTPKPKRAANRCKKRDPITELSNQYVTTTILLADPHRMNTHTLHTHVFSTRSLPMLLL